MKTSIILLLLCLFFTTLISPRTLAAERPAIQLATLYRQNIDIKHYWVSEKLDGVRAYWNGRQLVSRQGHVFAAPDWFTDGFPKVPLDGELWIGRQQFDLVSGTVRKKERRKELKKLGDHQGWYQVKLMIFDLPAVNASFTERVKQMQTLVEQTDSPYLQMIKQQRLDNQQQLMVLLDKVVADGGEGLMLHRGGAYYQASRSDDLMKLKRHFDAEAVVLKHLPGKGKYSGMLGALLVKTDDGVTFKIGSGFSDLERKNPPAIGRIITFKYYGKTMNNVPRFASFLRVR